MRSASVTNPFLNLPYDVLSEVAKRLPAVKSEKPWRDVNSLAITCKALRLWKKNKVNEDVRAEWNIAKKKIPGEKGWLSGLKSILGEFENTEKRLFREPILRRIANKRVAPPSGKNNESYRKFIGTIFSSRETASLNEIHDCLTLCSSAPLARKTKILAALPSLLSTLKSSERQMALRLMFNLLDEDKHLGQTLKDNGTFDKVKQSLSDDYLSIALLELGLHSRKRLSYNPKKIDVEFGLSSIPKQERWHWVLENVPECLNTKRGMQIMLIDPDCRTQMVDHLSKSFSECTTSYEKLVVCERLSTIYPNLGKSDNEKKLLRRVLSWFINKSYMHTDPRDGNRLDKVYLSALLNYLPVIKSDIAWSVGRIFLERYYQAISHAVQIKAYDQSTSIFIALAKDDIDFFCDKSKLTDKKYFPNSLTNKHALIEVLNRADDLRNSGIRDKFVLALRKNALYHFETDTSFFSDFMQAAEKIMKSKI